MRPLPIESLSRGPSFVLGLAVIRGEPIPVLELAALLAAQTRPETTAPARRFVTVRAGLRRVALSVDAVLGVRTLSEAILADLPPLFREESAASIAQIGTLDAELLLVLRGAQLVPDEVWGALEAREA